jgi:hypothetical protein
MPKPRTKLKPKTDIDRPSRKQNAELASAIRNQSAIQIEGDGRQPMQNRKAKPNVPVSRLEPGPPWRLKRGRPLGKKKI